MLMNFSRHGFSKECHLEIFLNGLYNTIRIWVDKGDGIISFYQRSVDEAYYLLEDMAEYDHWNWTCSRNNQDWESNSIIMEPQFDTQLQDKIAALNEVFTQGIEMMIKTREESFATA